MTCTDCAHFVHGGCVHPLSDRDFDSADRTPVLPGLADAGCDGGYCML